MKNSAINHELQVASDQHKQAIRTAAFMTKVPLNELGSLIELRRQIAMSLLHLGQGAPLAVSNTFNDVNERISSLLGISVFREKPERPMPQPLTHEEIEDMLRAPIKCATFDQSMISPEVRERMDADRAEAERIFREKTDKND